LLRGAFFFRGFRKASEFSGAETGGPRVSRRELKELMNSRAFGESPSNSLRCEAAASLGKEFV